MHTLFVFGTLRSEDTRLRVMRGVEAQNIRPAFLDNFVKRGLNILEKEGETVEGLVFEVNDDQLEDLDRYEGIGSLYDRINITVRYPDGTTEDMQAYQLIGSHAGI